MQKKRGKSDSDDDFVPGKKGLSRKMKGRSTRKTVASSDESATSEASDELYQLFEPESEEDVHASSFSSSENLDSDGSEYEPRGRNAKRAAAIKGNFRFTDIMTYEWVLKQAGTTRTLLRSVKNRKLHFFGHV